jgi:N-formylglutamate amidohydrolase
MKPYALYIAENKAINAATSPVIFDNPHSGRGLPDHFNFSCDKNKLMHFGDLHIEKLLSGIAKTGIPVLEGKIHRAVIDLNRNDDEINPDKVKGGWNRPFKNTSYVKEGFALVPELLGFPNNLTRIFNEAAQPDQKEIEKRINNYYRPYHDKLSRLIDDANNRHGVSFHMNIHSYSRSRFPDRADIIIGNDNNKSSNKELDDFIADFFKNEGMSVTFNDPYSGAAIVKNHSAPDKERHSIQIEIARDLYMKDDLINFDSDKGNKIKGILTRLAIELDKFGKNYAAELKSSTSKTSAHDDNNASSRSLKPT